MGNVKVKKEEKIKGILISKLNKERKEWKKLLGCDCKEVKTCTCLIFRYD